MFLHPSAANLEHRCSDRDTVCSPLALLVAHSFFVRVAASGSQQIDNEREIKERRVMEQRQVCVCACVQTVLCVTPDR